MRGLTLLALHVTAELTATAILDTRLTLLEPSDICQAMIAANTGWMPWMEKAYWHRV